MVIWMSKRDYLTYFIILALSLISIFRILYISIYESDKYNVLYENTMNHTFSESSAPRGRILDVNGKVLVDNIGVNTLTYNRVGGVSKKEEVETSLALAEVLEIDANKVGTSKLKKFYLLMHNNGTDLITEEEKELYKERKLSNVDLEALKISRITSDNIESMSDKEKIASYIYYAISNGYSFQSKVVKKGLTDSEVAKINELGLKGVNTVLTWERKYPYDTALKSIFGVVGVVPRELKEHYQSKGISLNSIVGISFLEYEYDDYLRGIDAVYSVNQNGKVELVSEEIQGSDLYLSIDIDTQLEVENILKTEMTLAKNAANTEYYNHSYVMVGNPKTGEIVAMAGLQISQDHFIDITSTIISSSYTVGSIVKGASMSVGYANGLIENGAYVMDSCIKVYGVTEKCSWTRLGAINDITAMAQSSNYFQFLIAVRLTNPNYTWNAKLGATKEHFDIYRKVFASYGLGTITGVDLPGETTGIIGKTVSDDLLLNLAIGQYDTYTPIEIFQYVNTIANDGIRLKPSLMKKIVNGSETLKKNEVTILNEAILSSDDIKRVQMGMREVMISGTGRNYADQSYRGVGKTGTSETFIDSNGDGKMDTKTISTAFVMYAPYEDPKYSIVIISPNISGKNGASTYKYSLNLRINRKISNYLFENTRE